MNRLLCGKLKERIIRDPNARSMLAVDGGMITCSAQGPHVYCRLSGTHIERTRSGGAEMNPSLRNMQKDILANGTRTAKYLWLMIIALLVVFITTLIAHGQKKKDTELRVTEGDTQSLGGKLQGFETQLSGQESGAMKLILWRAATAPLDDPAGTTISRVFFDLGSPSDKAAGGGILLATDTTPRPVQKKKIGGAGGQPPAPGGVQARGEEEPPNRPPPPQPRLEVLSAALGVGDVSMGPKHDDPKPPPPEAINALAAKLQAFGGQLSVAERGVFDWLLQRAGSKTAREAAIGGPLPGTPGGQPPSLRQALGIAGFGSRPGANLANGWLLRF